MKPLTLVFPIWLLQLFVAAFFYPASAQDTTQAVKPTEREDPWALLDSLSFRHENKKKLALVEEEFENYIKTASSPSLSQALSSQANLIAFLTDPNTPYIDRLAAAEQGIQIYDISNLGPLFESQSVLARLGHFVGARPSGPANMHFYYQQTPVTLFGNKYVPPKDPTPWPTTITGQKMAPWPWQVEQALERLWNGLVQNRELPENRLNWLEATLNMPCKTKREQLHFLKATQWIHTLTPEDREWPLILEILGVWRNIGLQAEANSASRLIPGFLDSLDASWQGTEGEWLSQAILVELFHKGKNRSDNAAFISSINTIVKNRWNSKRSASAFPATLTLIAIDALLQGKLSTDKSLSLTYSLLEIMDEPSNQVDWNISRDSPLLETQATHLLERLKVKGVELVILARAETVDLEAAREQIPYTYRCSPAN